MTICFHLENNPAFMENYWTQDAEGKVCKGTYVIDLDDYQKIGCALFSTIGNTDDKIFVMRGGCVYKVVGFGLEPVDDKRALLYFSLRFVEEVFNSEIVLRRTRKMDIVSIDGDRITVKPVELRKFDSMTFLLDEIKHHGYTVYLNGESRKIKRVTKTDDTVSLDLYSA